MSTEVEYIVVAEDSKPNRQILVMLLKKIGFTVLEGTNGEEAFVALETAIKENKKVVAIFSDVMMPVSNGISFLEKVRASDLYKDIPFVLCTALADKEIVMKSKALNVNGYLLKPIVMEKIVGKLMELFPERDFVRVAS